MDPHKLSRKGGYSLRLAPRPSPLDDEVLTLDPSQLAQRLIEQGWFRCRNCSGREHADSPHLLGLLRPDNERGAEACDSSRAEERSPIHYRITSSAQSSSGCAASAANDG